MRRLRPTGNRDRGAMALIVAIVVPVLLLGLGVLVVDVSTWYVSRSQTQNGADAGAIAVALSCAKNPTCDLNAANGYAGSNSSTKLGLAAEVTSGFPCGSGTGLPACGGGVEGSGKMCPAAPTAGTNYVDVHVKTKTDVTPVFSNGDGEKIGSCAQAIWGSASVTGNILALTFAECVWNTYTNGGNNYAPSPPTAPSSNFEVALALHNPDDPSDSSCTPAQGVGPLPGGFGWTNPNLNPNTPCTTTFISGNWYPSDPGNGTQTGSECTDKGNNAGVIPCAQNPVVPGFPSANNACPSPPTPSPLIIPIYDKVCVQPANGTTQDEIQDVVETNAAGGTFTLTFNDGTVSRTTAAINYNAPATGPNSVQSALAALSNIGGTANVSVTQTGTVPNVTWRVEFTGALADKNFTTMTSSPSLVDKKASLKVNPIQDGNLSTTTCPAGFANGKYYHLTTLTAFVITGYGGSSFAHDQRSWLTGKRCNQFPNIPNNTGCIIGYFVKAVTSGGNPGPGPGTGVSVVKLSG